MDWMDERRFGVERNASQELKVERDVEKLRLKDVHDGALRRGRSCEILAAIQRGCSAKTLGMGRAVCVRSASRPQTTASDRHLNLVRSFFQCRFDPFSQNLNHQFAGILGRGAVTGCWRLSQAFGRLFFPTTRPKWRRPILLFTPSYSPTFAKSP